MILPGHEVGKLNESGGELPPLTKREHREVIDEHLHANVVGTSIVVLAHPGRDRIDVTPRHERIDQPIRPRMREIVLTEAKAAQIVGVVRELEINLKYPDVRARVPGRNPKT